MDIEQARFNMVEQQIRPWDVLDTKILDLFQSVPREAFVDSDHIALAFADIELPIGHSQCMMSPKVEARMLQALHISKQDRILEIGTGSGFITACLANMGAHVTSFEFYDDLSASASSRLQAQGINNVDCAAEDIFKRLPTLGRYDVIAVTGSLPDSADSADSTDRLLSHLQENGRMFCVLGDRPVMTAKRFTRVAENNYRHDDLFETELPALLSTHKTQAFTF